MYLSKILLSILLLLNLSIASEAVPDWMNNLNDAKELALKEKKPIILFLHSRRCFYCPKIIEGVFTR